MEENYRILKELALSKGAALFGVADIKGIKDSFLSLEPEAVADLKHGISLACKLSDPILEGISDHPTKLYFYHYRQVNIWLDQLALGITIFIQRKGYKALPIPSSQVINWEKGRGHLSHKEIAWRAGLGWWGRNNLLVNPVHGARIRLVTILTNMPLRTDVPLREDCGTCRECLAVCPAGAIKEKREDFDHLACYRKLDEFRRKYNIGHHICGICVKVCRGGREK